VNECSGYLGGLFCPEAGFYRIVVRVRSAPYGWPCYMYVDMSRGPTVGFLSHS